MESSVRGILLIHMAQSQHQSSSFWVYSTRNGSAKMMDLDLTYAQLHKTKTTPNITLAFVCAAWPARAWSAGGGVRLHWPKNLGPSNELGRPWDMAGTKHQNLVDLPTNPAYNKAA